MSVSISWMGLMDPRVSTAHNSSLMSRIMHPITYFDFYLYFFFGRYFQILMSKMELMIVVLGRTLIPYSYHLSKIILDGNPVVTIHHETHH